MQSRTAYLDSRHIVEILPSDFDRLVSSALALRTDKEFVGYEVFVAFSASFVVNLQSLRTSYLI